MPRRRATGRRIAILGGGVLALLLLIAVAAGFYARSQLRASRPILSGTVTLAGLSAPAEVERDGLGIPRIKAETIRDGYRVLGYLHAQERFFQMDLQRRQPAGELAALAGAAAAPVDREARLHRMRTRTEQAAEALPAEARRTFEAYRDGVAAGLAGLTAPPFEYLLLGQEPAAWRISDSLLTVVAMYFVLNDATGAHEARTAALETALPAELAAFLNPPGTDRDAPLHGEAFPVPKIPGPAAFAKLRRSGPVRPAEPPAISGSNSWAVAPQRAAGGVPLMASDMHLPLGVPNIWYRAELHIGDARLRGLTLPGVPAVIAGSTGNVAWGFTNSQGDWTDLVELETDPADPLRYRTPDGWRRMEVFEEEIQVAGGPSETLEVHETIWGPVSTEWGRPVAIRWIAHDPEGLRTAYLGFAEASNVEEVFRRGWGSGMPPQNLVAVDREGSIGWTIAGPIPRRRGFDGRTPMSWADGARSWDGYLEPGQIPVIRNPESGLIWTANNRLVDGEFLDRIGRGGSYVHGERARLIRDRLLGVESADEAAMLDIQLEDRAEEFAVWRRLFIRSLEGASEPLATEALRVLREGWTGRASVGSAAYPLVRNARVALFTKVYGALTAPAENLLPNFSPWVAIHWPGPLLRLAEEAPAHFVPPGAADWDEALRQSVLESAARMSAAGPLAEQTWGKENLVHVRHPLSPGLPPLLSRFLSPYLDAPPRGLPGDAGLPRAQNGNHGPSNRFVVAPGREETGILHMPGGQSGHPGMPYYLSGHRDWEEGRATPFLAGPTEWTLTLVPE